MTWTLSEFLSLLDLNGRTWCIVEINSGGGIRIPPNDSVYFYAVLHGSCRVAGVTDMPLEMHAGDACIILSGQAHAIRTGTDSQVTPIEFLCQDQDVDTPPTISVGTPGPTVARIVCGKLKAAWRGELRRQALPSIVAFQPAAERIAVLSNLSSGEGASELLTRLAGLTLAIYMRSHPLCPAYLELSAPRDPIKLALHLVQSDLSADWTVTSLAARVGLSRSTFAARFRAQCGKAPMEAVTELRMQYAAELLRQGQAKLAEIGALTGYCSESSFSRCFTRFFGVPPSKMRSVDQASVQSATAIGLPARRAVGASVVPGRVPVVESGCTAVVA